jgi:hypothetical protein
MRAKVILNDRTKSHNIGFIAITEDQHERLRADMIDISMCRSNRSKDEKISELRKILNFNPRDILAYGSTNITDALANLYIPRIQLGTWFYKRYNDPSYLHYSYCCYKSDRWDYTKGFITGPIHDTALQSWLCAMEICHKPDYGIVLKLNKDADIYKIKIYNEDYTPVTKNLYSTGQRHY